MIGKFWFRIFWFLHSPEKWPDQRLHDIIWRIVWDIEHGRHKERQKDVTRVVQVFKEIGRRGLGSEINWLIRAQFALGDHEIVRVAYEEVLARLIELRGPSLVEYMSFEDLVILLHYASQKVTTQMVALIQGNSSLRRLHLAMEEVDGVLKWVKLLSNLNSMGKNAAAALLNSYLLDARARITEKGRDYRGFLGDDYRGLLAIARDGDVSMIEQVMNPYLEYEEFQANMGDHRQANLLELTSVLLNRKIEGPLFSLLDKVVGEKSPGYWVDYSFMLKLMELFGRLGPSGAPYFCRLLQGKAGSFRCLIDHFMEEGPEVREYVFGGGQSSRHAARGLLFEARRIWDDPVSEIEEVLGIRFKEADTWRKWLAARK